MKDDYSESIDWDLIYRAFHDPEGVARRIHSIIGQLDSPLLFCGFPEVASFLSDHYEVVYIDSSPVIASRSRARYPNIARIVESEITSFLEGSAATDIVISGRLSAFWQNPQEFDKLAMGLLSHSRGQVVIDYFDRKQIHSGLVSRFNTEAGWGKWHYLDLELPLPGAPPIHNVNLEIAYAVDSVKFAYPVRRAYFNRSDMELWHRSRFLGYETSLVDGLLSDDPSFTVRMVSS